MNKILKICSFILLFCCAGVTVLSQQKNSLEAETYILDVIKEMRINSKSLDLIDYEDGKKENDYVVSRIKFNPTNIGGLNYLKTSDGKKFLLLQGEDVCLIYENGNHSPKYFGTTFDIELLSFASENSASASTELREKDIVYTASNAVNANIDEVWAEGAAGLGIGESISFYLNARYIYVMNGYISYSKPELYLKNGRVKSAKISFPNSERESIEVELDDKPEPQKIDLGDCYCGRVSLEIVDVYKGTKYDDTCITGLFCKVF